MGIHVEIDETGDVTASTEFDSLSVDIRDLVDDAKLDTLKKMSLASYFSNLAADMMFELWKTGEK